MDTFYYLKNGQQGTRDCVEVWCWRSVIEIEVATKKLHSKQGKDEYEEKKEEQQWQNGCYGVHQGDHKISKVCPVPKKIRCD